MQLEVTNQEADYLVQVLLTRPLGEAYTLFESVRGQIAQQATQAGAGAANVVRMAPVPQQGGEGLQAP